MDLLRFAAVGAGVLAIGLGAAAPALANPLDAKLSLSGNYSFNPGGGLTATGLAGTYNEVATGTYDFANSFASMTTPYNLALSGNVSVDNSTVLSGTSNMFSSSISNLGVPFSAMPTYGPLLVDLGNTLLLGSNPGTLTYQGLQIYYDSTGSGKGNFSIGSNDNLGLGPAVSTGTLFASASLINVPEPSSVLLFGTGLLGLLIIRRRRPL